MQAWNCKSSMQVCVFACACLSLLGQSSWYPAMMTRAVPPSSLGYLNSIAIPSSVCSKFTCIELLHNDQHLWFCNGGVNRHDVGWDCEIKKACQVGGVGHLTWTRRISSNEIDDDVESYLFQYTLIALRPPVHNGLMQKTVYVASARTTYIYCVHPPKLDDGIMLIFVSEKNGVHVYQKSHCSAVSIWFVWLRNSSNRVMTFVACIPNMKWSFKMLSRLLCKWSLLVMEPRQHPGNEITRNTHISMLQKPVVIGCSSKWKMVHGYQNG